MSEAARGALAAGQQIRVVIADDHPAMRTGIMHELEHAPDIQLVGVAEHGEAALRIVERLSPDVLVLDLSMPGLPATETVRQARQIHPGLQVLMLSAYGEVSQVLALLEAGATGYLLKDEDPVLIAVGIRAIVKGRPWLSPAVGLRMVEQSPRATAGPDELSERELEVLRLLAEGKSNQQISDLACLSERTVRYHLRNIQDKLGLGSRSEAIVWAIRHLGGTRSS